MVTVFIYIFIFELHFTLKFMDNKIIDLVFLVNDSLYFKQYRYGNNMKNPKILLITDDVLAASKIIRWLDSWDYNVNIMDFGNELISNNNILNMS